MPIFHAEVDEAGSDLAPVQYGALVTLIKNPGIHPATLVGLIAYDRTTIGEVVEQLEPGSAEDHGARAERYGGRDVDVPAGKGNHRRKRFESCAPALPQFV